MLDAVPRVVGTTTATRAGFGFDSPVTRSGAWTSAFLVQGLMARPAPDLARHFTACHDAYVCEHRAPADQPCFFGRLDDRRWNTEENPLLPLPPDTFRLDDWL